MQLTSWGLQDNLLVALIIFCISFTGSVGNWLVATSTQRFPSMRNSFGLLLSSQSTGEAVFCTLFAFFYSPMVFFDIHSMKFFSRRVGMILLMCYDICIYSHLFITLNRMCAICFPLKYNVFFSNFNTKIFIAITWIAAVTRCVISYGLFDCDLFYEESIWTFLFTGTEDCKFISKYLDFSKDVTIVVIIATLDIIAIVKVHVTNVQTCRGGRCEMDVRRKKEINFLKQVILQGVVFVVELFTYFHLSLKFENRWIIWALCTVMWNVVHCSDSLIIIGFNVEFRKLIASPKNIFKTKSSVANYTSTTGASEK